MLVEWTVGMFVLALSIGALIGLALRDGDRDGVTEDPSAPSTTEAVVRDGVAERAGPVSDLVEPEER